MQEVDFLGLVIGADGKLRESEGRRKQAWELKVPRNLKELRSLLGFTSFFKKFIPNYFAITKPLLECLKKDCFKIEGDQESAVKRISEAKGKSRDLILPDFLKNLNCIRTLRGRLLGLY